MKTTTTVKDPVCGMKMETATTSRQTRLEGQTYYFCGYDCKEGFDLDPEQYLDRPERAPKSSHACCA